MVREGGDVWCGCLLCGPELDHEPLSVCWGFQRFSVPICNTGMMVVPASWAGWGLAVLTHTQCLEYSFPRESSTGVNLGRAHMGNLQVRLEVWVAGSISVHHSEVEILAC